jgi:hypothetical protein
MKYEAKITCETYEEFKRVAQVNNMAHALWKLQEHLFQKEEVSRSAFMATLEESGVFLDEIWS